MYVVEPTDRRSRGVEVRRTMGVTSDGYTCRGSFGKWSGTEQCLGIIVKGFDGEQSFGATETERFGNRGRPWFVVTTDR